MSRESVTSAIAYSGVKTYGTNIKYLRLQMSNLQSTTLTVYPTATSQAWFKMPFRKVFNWNKSILSCSLTVPAAPALTSTAVTVDCPSMIQSAIVETGSAYPVLNYPYCNKVNKVLNKINTPFVDYMNKDATDLAYPSRVLKASNLTALSTGTRKGDTTTIDYTENQYLSSTAAATAQTLNVQLHLSDLKNSVLSTDKNVYIDNHDVYAKFTIDAVNNWCYEALTDGTLTSATLTNPIGTLTNMYLYLAIEEDETICASVIDYYNKGQLKILVDYPVVTRTQGLAANATHNVVVQLNSTAGSRLKRIYQTVFHTTESLDTNFDCSNIAGAKISSYNSYLDSKKLQTEDPTISATSVDTWRMNRALCENSMILNKQQYEKNWFICEMFDSLNKDKDSATSIEGLPMNDTHTYYFNATVTGGNTALVYYTIAIFQRQLSISKDGITYVEK